MTLRLLRALILMLGCGLLPAYCQRCNFESHTDGLENLKVRALLQDAQGYSWLGTEIGASKT